MQFNKRKALMRTTYLQSLECYIYSGIAIILSVILLTLSIDSIAATKNTDKKAKCVNEINAKKLPKYLCFKNRKLGFILNHYHMIKDFDTTAVSDMTIAFNASDNEPFVSTVKVTNSKNQALFYQVSNQYDTWNRVWGYHGKAFYILYDYYPYYTYRSADTNKEYNLIKSIRYYDANGNPGSIQKIFKKEYVIQDKEKLIAHVTKSDLSTFGNKKTMEDDKKNKLVLEIFYYTNGKVWRKQYISSRQYSRYLQHR